MTLQAPQHFETIDLRHSEIQQNADRKRFSGFPTIKERDCFFSVSRDLYRVQHFLPFKRTPGQIDIDRSIFNQKDRANWSGLRLIHFGISR